MSSQTNCSSDPKQPSLASNAYKVRTASPPCAADVPAHHSAVPSDAVGYCTYERHSGMFAGHCLPPHGKWSVLHAHNALQVFLPITRLCRDACGYCTFAQPPQPGRRAYMTLQEVLAVARLGAQQGCIEALFTLGGSCQISQVTAHSPCIGERAAALAVAAASAWAAAAASRGVLAVPQLSAQQRHCCGVFTLGRFALDNEQCHGQQQGCTEALFTLGGSQVIVVGWQQQQQQRLHASAFS
jgi:hypothetical protein